MVERRGQNRVGRKLDQDIWPHCIDAFHPFAQAPGLAQIARPIRTVQVIFRDGSARHSGYHRVLWMDGGDIPDTAPHSICQPSDVGTAQGYPMTLHQQCRAASIPLLRYKVGDLLVRTGNPNLLWADVGNNR